MFFQGEYVEGDGYVLTLTQNLGKSYDIMFFAFLIVIMLVRIDFGLCEVFTSDTIPFTNNYNIKHGKYLSQKKVIQRY